MKVKKLKDSFKTNGLDYSVMRRTEKVALVGVHHRSHSEPHAYETHLIKVTKPHLRDTEAIEQGFEMVERLASNEQFGKYGWSWLTLEDAEQSFNQLVAKSA